MKKRMLAVLLALMMVFTCMPATAWAWYGVDDDRPIISVEKYDEKGNGTFLLEPTRVDKTSASYLDEWIPKVLGSDNVKIGDDYNVTGYIDDSQEDGWLDNGDMGTSSKWLVWVQATNKYGVDRRYTNPGDYRKISDLDMVRIIFVADGAQIDMTTVDKEDLYIYASGLTETEKSEKATAYQAALAAILNKDATQEDVDAALAALQRTEGTAVESVTVSPDSLTMAPGETKALEASMEPETADAEITWSSDATNVATVDDKGVVTAVADGTATITAAAGGKSDTCTVTVDSTQPYVRFVYEDGSFQHMQNGEFTLGALDVGHFEVANAEAAVVWPSEANEEKIVVYDPWTGAENFAYHWYVNKDTGAWQPSGYQPTKAVTVQAGSFSTSFKINYVSTSGVTELKTYVNGQEVNTTDKPYTTTGIVYNVPVTVQGLKNGNWITIPEQALEYSANDPAYNFRFEGSQMIINRAGEHTMTVKLKGESISTSFKAECGKVAATAMKVVCPTTVEIDQWDAAGGSGGEHYVGLRPFTGFDIEFTPANATNRDTTWESLTPDVAYYDPNNSNGIVPLKAGIARFKVTNTEDPTLTDEVTIQFVYKYPLTAASSSESTYKLDVNAIQPLTINVTPSNATEQRFTWTYSQSGIVEVTDKVNFSEDGLTSWYSHQIKGLKDGTVTVTGTPYDQTGGCKPVTFTVVVGNGGDSGIISGGDSGIISGGTGTAEPPAVQPPAEDSENSLQALIDGVENTRLIAHSEKVTNGIRIYWTKSKGYKVDYYEVFRSTKRYEGYGKTAFFTTANSDNPTKCWYINTKDLKEGTRYYYKVRGVRVLNGQKYYTQWSTKAWRIA